MPFGLGGAPHTGLVSQPLTTPAGPYLVVAETLPPAAGFAARVRACLRRPLAFALCAREVALGMPPGISMASGLQESSMRLVSVFKSMRLFP